MHSLSSLLHARALNVRRSTSQEREQQQEAEEDLKRIHEQCIHNLQDNYEKKIVYIIKNKLCKKLSMLSQPLQVSNMLRTSFKTNS